MGSRTRLLPRWYSSLGNINVIIGSLRELIPDIGCEKRRGRPPKRSIKDYLILIVIKELKKASLRATETDWSECVGKGIVKDVKSDEGMIKSLINSSNNKLESEEMLAMSETTATSKLSLAYDSLRELLEALALQQGFRIYNHEYYTAFLKEIINESSMGDEFDEIRRVRNAVNYYGKDISMVDAEKYIERIKSLRKLVLRMLGIS